jgi:hypothetical protein
VGRSDRRGYNRRRAFTALGAFVISVATCLAATGTTTAGPSTVTVDWGTFTAGGDFAPRALSKDELTPIAADLDVEISGSPYDVGGLHRLHPPALQQLTIDADRNIVLDVTGYPKCGGVGVQYEWLQTMQERCRPALLGVGRLGIEIVFAGDTPVPVYSRMWLYNGGERNGVITLFAEAYITIPVPASIVTKITARKMRSDRVGTLITASIPKIAGGSGSVTSLKLRIARKLTDGTKGRAVLSARCPDGKLAAGVTALFADGTHASTRLVRPCTRAAPRVRRPLLG